MKHDNGQNANDAYRKQYTGRKGFPLPGCDCMWCFGYCAYDQDAAMRETFAELPLDLTFTGGTE